MRDWPLRLLAPFGETYTMRYLLNSRRFWLLPLALAMACATWVVAAILGENEGVEDIYNLRLHQVLVERQATGLQDLAERFLKDQQSYLWITPLDPEFILFQPGETILILDLKAFPASFIDSLAGEIVADGVVRFPVWIYEDADSPGREIVIESLEQKVIARIGRDRDYSPEWFVRALYPALDTYAEWRRDWLTACYDPARVCMRYDLLVGEDNLIQYVWARSIEAARLAEEREAAAMMRSGEGGSVSNLQFTAIGLTTNGTIGLTLAWPDEGLSTNVVDIFACTDLCARDWALADTLTLDMQTNRVVWVDADSMNHVTRFYDAWTHHDSDGDGIPDGREVRLYGTDPDNWDTDGDGLSDYAEIFVHGTSVLNADSDGDGLPDGWEVQYGLNALDATGDNGAYGDPDGDGFTNLQEFQRGGDPTNQAINATQLIHRLMHSRGDSSMRVDVEDSYNCGGTNPNRQEVEDVFSVGPLMHCGYLLSLTVEGRVEDHNSGYDKVSVRAYTATELHSEVPFFEGHNNGNGCAMVDEQATTNVWFWSNGSVRLRYDTVDGLYHADAYAEITAAAFVDVLKLDLDIGSVSEEDEETVGGFVPVNADNDNGSTVTHDIPATRDFDTDGYTDDDLVPISLSLQPTTGLSGTLRLRKVEGGRDRIKVWETTGKGTEVSLPKTWTVGTDTIPATLFIEGLKEGQALRDIDLVLEYLQGGTVLCDDKVKATVTPVLSNLVAVACTNVPDYYVGADTLEMLWSNGGWGTPTVSMKSAVWNITNPAGQLRVVQHVNNQGLLASGAGAINSDGGKWKWDFAPPHGGATLVDGFGTGATWDPFYADDDASAILYKSDDTPRIWVGPDEILPASGKSTAIDIKQNFTMYAVWQFSDDTVYFLGNTTWNIRYQGVLTNTAGTIAFPGGADNKTTGSSGFTRDNADQNTGEPGATDAIAPWRWP